jgi:hypothetical protein
MINPISHLTGPQFLEPISKIPAEQYKHASEVDKAEEILDVMFVAHHESSEVLQPGKQPFDFPTSAVAAQRAPVLARWTDSAAPMGRDHLDTPLGELGVQRIAVVGEVPDQPFGKILGEALLDSAFSKGDFMRASRRRVDGDRSASAVCHCHELRTLAPLGLADGSAPFFAITKVASIKHSLKLSLPRLRKSSANASTMCLNTPLRTHSWKRRWQVWYGGKRLGISCQRAPERKIHRMPFSICRSSRLGRPLPSSRFGSSGIRGSTISHCSSVSSSRRVMPRRYQSVQ